VIRISEEPTEFDFSSLIGLKKENKKEEQKDLGLRNEVSPKSKNVIPKAIRSHPIVQDFTAMMDNEVEKTRLGEMIIDKIESLETNYDLEFMQKLITIKNVLNYTQSAWSFGVCKEICDGISIRGSQKKIAHGLISTIKKMAKVGY